MHSLIQRKMVAAALAAPSLKKEERNNEAKFNFVGIDRFYSDVAKVLHDMGIGWKTVEVGIDLIPHAYQQEMIVLQKFRFDVWDSESGEYQEGYSFLTIPAPFSDAQTAGISLSYADKAFLRTSLKIVTGEKDADHFAKAKGKPNKAEVAQANTDDPLPELDESSKDAKQAEPETKKKPTTRKTDKPAAEAAGEAASDQFAVIADRLLDLISGLESASECEQFRVDQQGDINVLKTAAKTNPEAEKQKNRVQEAYSAKYDEFSPPEEEE